MSYSPNTRAIHAGRSRKLRRPAGVVLVACFQALKSAVLIVTAFVLRFRPGQMISAQSVLYQALYVAMRGNVTVLNNALNGGSLLPALILAFGAYLAYIATALWQLQPFARRAMMLTSGLTFLLYVKSAVTSNGDGTMSGMNFFSPDLHNVHILLFIDTAIFVYLARGATADHFRMQGQRV